MSNYPFIFGARSGNTGGGGGGGNAGIEEIIYSELYNKVVSSTLVPLQWYRLTDYRSVNFLNGIDIAMDNPTPVDPNFNPREIHTGEIEVLLLQAISESEISPIGYSEDFEGEFVEYRPYTNKIGVGSEFHNGQILPNSAVMSGFDLQWDGDNVFFEMPEDYPALFGQMFFITASFDGGSYLLEEAFLPLTPSFKIGYNPTPLSSNIIVQNGGYKIVLLDLTEQNFLDYSSDSLHVFTNYEIGDAYGEVVRRIDTFKSIDVPFDYRGIKYRRFECEILGNITVISHIATGLTATDGIYIVNMVSYTTDTVQGEKAEFKIFVNGGSVTEVKIDIQGRLYAIGETFTIDGTVIGGVSGDDDIVITIDNVNSNIGYWGQGDVFQDAATTGNYQDFPVFTSNSGNIEWSLYTNIGPYPDNNVFTGSIFLIKFKGSVKNNTAGDVFVRSTIGDEFQFNTIINEFYDNQILSRFENNVIDSNFGNNEIASGFRYNLINSGFQNNKIDYGFEGNVIDFSFQHNSINKDFSYNIVGSSFYGNTIGINFGSNKIEDDFIDNIIENSFYNNTIGDGFDNNSIGNYFEDNTIDRTCFQNTIGNNFYNNVTSMYFAHNKIGNYFFDNTIDENFGFGYSTSQGNVIGNYFHNNTIGEYFYNNTIADGFYSNTIGDFFQLNNVKTSVAFIDFTITPATYVYEAYNCDIFRRSDFDLRLSYYDSSDVLNIDDITN